MVRRGVVLGVLLAVVAAAAAQAARTPVYRYPASFTPPKRPPAAAPAPGQPSVPLSSTGAFPDMVIDAAGTAHIVWTEGRGDQADVVVYCRLKRGAKACDNPPTELVWDKSYGTGDGPQFNIDNGGPRIVLAGDQLIVLDKRYPTVGVKPDGSSSSTLVAWASSNGGQRWSSPAAILGKYDLGQAAVLVKGAEQSVLNFGYDALCPGMCLEEYTSGAYTSGGQDFSTGPNQNYSPTLAIGADGVPTIGFADLSNHVLLRRWK
ncbi:MAG: hypothetical protein QOG68_2036, partial [Solirubrobacteraceae bacterium]|nr:hypothetical protein [Solirubrobacteraceae bacterium]